MTAIITSKFRVLNAENFKEDVSDQNTSVYVGIGKSDAWSLTTSDTTDTIPFLPKDTIDDVGEAYQNLIGLKRITSSEISHVIARYTWTSGASYVPWDSADPDIFDKPFYVITSEFKVYKCIRAGGASSTIQPVQTLTAPQSESDGYVWKYMYTLSVADAEKFLTISYMPVKTVSLDFESDAAAELALSEADYAQYLNQKNSRDSGNVAGIERVVVTAGGTGYTSAPTVTITGDGAGAAATATVANGIVTAVNITNKGTNYTVADITFSGGGGSDAGARAVISPLGGHGVDPVRELGAFYTAINTQLNGTEGGDITVGNDFRQVSLIKNPYNYGTTTVATATTLKATKSLDFTAATDVTNYQVDELLVGQTSGAQAYVVEINASTGLVYIHQNSKTGYANFEASEQVLGQTSNTTGQLESAFLGNPEIQPGSGQMIFLENRDPINRTTTQIEDIKIIIEF
jgi:hypothetical protein